MKIYKYQNLGHADHGWLDARHHFSFGSYQDENRLGFGDLLVINDDKIAAQKGFDTHPHKDMEIITYVRKGAITHRDSNNNEGKTSAGNVQVMSAGKGVFHSEYNLENEETNLYQIWIKPNKLGVKSRWDMADFPQDFVADKLNLLVSGDEKAPLFIHANAEIYAGKLRQNTKLQHGVKYQNFNKAYILISSGSAKINGQILEKGDGAEVENIAEIDIEALSDLEILVINLI